MGTIDVRIVSLKMNWQSEGQSEIEIEGKIYVDVKKGLRFIYSKNCLTFLPLTDKAVVPEISRTNKAVIKNTLIAYTASTLNKCSFEIYTNDDGCCASDCALED